MSAEHETPGGPESRPAPGAFRVRPGTRELNHREDPADRLGLVLENTGDRPVQIGSHIHLPDVNPAVTMDRAAARGFRLDIPSGTSLRLEPGASREVAAVRFSGSGRVPGLQVRRADDAGAPRPGGTA